MLKTYLPDEIILDGHIVLKPVHPNTNEEKARAIRTGRSYRTVKVLSRNLRGKTDLHGRPYQPTEWLFIEDLEATNKRVIQEMEGDK